MTNQKVVIGRTVYVDFPELKLRRVLAKVDTGSYRGTLHCTNIEIKEKNGESRLSFVPLDLRHPNFSHKPVEFDEYFVAVVKRTDGHREQRYVIETPIIIDGKKYKIEISLSNRTDMRSPVLLGRKFLRGKFVVDVDL